MLNLVLSGFTEKDLPAIYKVIDRMEEMRVIQVDNDQEALAATERGVTVAVITLWSSRPTEERLRFIPKLVNLRIPAIQVLSADVPAEAKVAAIEAGAIDCIGIHAIEGRLALLLDVFVERSKLIEKELDHKVVSLSGDGLAFSSPEMKELLSRLSRVAPLSSTILLTGETGVGKSTLARWIHQQSARSHQPFVDVPCAALPSNLIESELFGHVRGAFTSADRDHAGRFTVAGKGTLLLDEVDCLPLEIQGKLLRAVELREFEKVGSTLTQKLDARLVVATNRPLEIEVAEGRFRSDLFYRLGVMSFRIPPLRERLGAIERLATTFCTQFARQHDRKVAEISPSAMAMLNEYSWPGNVRELRNALDYAVAVSTGHSIQWRDLPESIRNPKGNFASVSQEHSSPLPVQDFGIRCNQFAVARKEAERELLVETLRKNNNNRSKTAADLGVSRVTLYKLLARFPEICESRPRRESTVLE